MIGDFKVIRSRKGTILIARLVLATEALGQRQAEEARVYGHLIEVYDPSFDHTDVGRIIGRYSAMDFGTRQQAYNLSLGGQIESDLLDAMALRDLQKWVDKQMEK